MVRAAAKLNADINLYQQIEAVLRDQIADGVLRSGARLPPEEDLCGHFKVSRGPVRQALHGLERDGLIERNPGRGTFVRASGPRLGHERSIMPWSDVIKSSAKKAKRLTLTGKSVPPAIVNRSLSLPSDVEISFFIRLFGTGEAPVGIKRYLHPSLAGSLERLAGASDFDRCLAAVTGTQCTTDDVWVEAILAEPRFAMQLKVPLGSPLLSLWWVNGAAGTPVVCTQMLQPGATVAVAISPKGAADEL